jgi:protein-disulfide isomerase
MKLKSLLSGSALLLALVALPVTAPFAAEPAALTDAQKSEIQAVVKDYLVKNPAVMEEAMLALQDYMRDKELSKSGALIEQNYAQLTDTTSTGFVGNAKGDVVIVEFFDYQCGYCRKAFNDVQALVAADKNVKVVYREFPILGEESVLAARVALAAHKQGKYTPFHDALMGSSIPMTESNLMGLAKQVGLDTDKLKADMSSDSVEEELSRNYAMAQALGIRSTPTFIVGNLLVPGAMDQAEMQKMVEQVRANQKTGTKAP